jgi:ATP-dependent DNA helicase RecG
MHGQPGLDVDHLLVIHYLTRHREVTARTASQLCQRPLDGAREILGELVNRWKLLEAGGGGGRGRYYRLSRTAYDLLVDRLSYHIDRRLATENAKARVLAALEERPLTNSDVREITQMGRSQVIWLMKKLQKENLVALLGRGRGSRWRLHRGA